MLSDPRKKLFTDRFLRSIKPLRPADPEYRKAWWDTVVPGLCIRPGQRITFYTGKRPQHSPKFVWTRLGDYPVLSLSEARTRARQVVAALADGKPVPVPVRHVMTFANAAELYIEQCLDGKRTRIEIEQQIRGKLVPAIGHMPLTAITHEDLVAVLSGIADRSERHASGRLVTGGPHAARKAHVYLRGMLQWFAFKRIGGLQSDPSRAIPAKELLRGRSFNRQRARVLTDAELRIVWQAAELFGYPFGGLVVALILTGQRLNEIAKVRWAEIDGATLLIPGERMKNMQAHTVPLSPRMQELLGSLPRFDDDFIFTTTFGKRPISGFSKYKARFDKAIAEINPIDPWQLHDIRRTVRTGLARAGVPVFDAELVVAHQQTGVHGVYDRHRYDAEKRAALLRWEKLLVEILEPPPANVVPMRTVS